MSASKTNTPLTPAVLYILMTLSDGDKHGYAIMKHIENDSEGKISMGNGTLYGSLKRMLDAGLIAESDTRVDSEMDGQRRVYYKITGLGQRALTDELDRYNKVIAVAKRRVASHSFA